MGETLVLDEVCSSCGKEARPDALFCYHCGGSLEPVDNAGKDGEPSNAWFRGDITEQKDSGNESENKEKIIEEKSEPQEEDIIEEEPESEIVEKVEEEKKEDKEEPDSEKPEENKDSKTDVQEDSKSIEDEKLEKKIEKPNDNRLEELEEQKQEEKVKVKAKPFKEKEDESPKLKKDTKLKSVSALRNRKKPDRLKKIEINWEEQDDSPNIWFIIFGLVFALFVAGMVFLAFYLK